MKNGQITLLLGIGILGAVWAVGCGGSGGGSGSSAGTYTAPLATPTVQATPVATPTVQASPAVITIDAINNSSAPMGYSFQSPVSAHSGDTIKWVNVSAAPHGITWGSQSPSSSPGPGPNIAVFSAGTTSNSFLVPTVTQATTYNYHCTIHGPTMPGVINVAP